MVQLNIPLPDEQQEAGQERKFKIYSSPPLSFGLQKAFARLGIKQAQLFERAKASDAAKSVMDGTGTKYDGLIQDIDDECSEMTGLLIRAFGNQFTADDLDRADGEEVTRAFARLQVEASGAAGKNSPGGSARP